MKKILLENGTETLECYIGEDGAIYQSDPDPKMLGYSRIYTSKREASNKGYIVVNMSCKGRNR